MTRRSSSGTVPTTPSPRRRCPKMASTSRSPSWAPKMAIPTRRSTCSTSNTPTRSPRPSTRALQCSRSTSRTTTRSSGWGTTRSVSSRTSRRTRRSTTARARSRPSPSLRTDGPSWSSRSMAARTISCFGATPRTGGAPGSMRRVRRRPWHCSASPRQAFAAGPARRFWGACRCSEPTASSGSARPRLSP